MTGQERNALRLAARLLESGLAVEPPEPDLDGGHVRIGMALAGRLARVVDDPERAREIVAALRAAADEVPAG